MTTTAPAAGSALAPLVDVLLAEPLNILDVPALQAAIETVTPEVGRLQGWLTAATGQLDARTGGAVLDEDTGRPRTVAGWLAQVQHGTASAAGSQLRTARLLRELPLVTAAVLDGILTPAQAGVLTRLVGKIQPEALVESQPQLIAVAAPMDPAQLGVWVAHQLAAHCEPALEADQAAAHDKRYLTSRREADGSLYGRFRLSPEDSEVLLTALEPLARKAGEDDRRTAGQRRADALVELSEQVLRHGTLPDAGGLRPQLSYVLPADWAAAQQQQGACTACGPRCPDHPPLTFTDTIDAALPGHGGIRAEQACATGAWSGPQTRARIEALLCDARITRVLLTPLGQVTGFQPLRDSVTPAQRRNLAARDVHCVVRGCTRPPAMCDAHHLRHRADGGATTMENLVLLCRRHHVLWHQGKIQLHHLTVPWHPEQSGAPPLRPLDDLFPSPR
jgi:hypothetical protein